MEIKSFLKTLNIINSGEFFTGVPDSLLSPLCDYLMVNQGIGKRHIIAANEGNAVALAAGYHLATGKIPIVYMQNSGIGNTVNPIASLLNEKVYGIPCIFIVGWRGEPGVKDEPQHVFQGEVTVTLLEVMNIHTMVIGESTTAEDISAKIGKFKEILSQGKSIAFVIKKGALTSKEKGKYKNDYSLLREEIIREITSVSDNDIIVSTTGKASRELFEIRERNHQAHKYDFLTVGSMGHSSSIALSIALNKPNSKIWCIDGDGAALMHMGAMAVIGANSPANLIHIVINNCSHETVGGMPTVGGKINFTQIAEGCGYKKIIAVDNVRELKEALRDVRKSNQLCFVEIKASLGSRADLGRPTTTAKENKDKFMEYLKELK